MRLYSGMSIPELLAHLRAGRHAEALRAWRALGPARLDDPDLVELGASLLTTLRNHREAASTWRRLVELRPGDVEAVRLMAQSLLDSGDAALAVRVLADHGEAHPDDADAHALLARALLRRQQLAEALAAALRALDARRGDGDLQLLVAHLLARAGHLEQARALVAVSPRATSAAVDRAEALSLLSEPAAALAAWEEVLRREPDNAWAMAGLAVCHEDLRAPDEAARWAEAAAERAPELVLPRRVLLRVHHQQGRLDAARDVAHVLLARDLPRRARAGVLMELAIVERRRGAWDAAFARAQEGNALVAELHRRDGHDLDAWPRLVRALRARPPCALVRPRPHGPPPAPLFLLGLPRSGTTLCQQVLQAHPAVHALDEVDPALAALRAYLQATGLAYPACLDTFDDGDWGALRRAYAERTADLPPHELLVDKLPLNLVHLDYLEHLFPDARVVVMVRDPRDVLLSNYFQDYAPNPAMVQFTDLERGARALAQVLDLWLSRRECLTLPWREQRYEDLVADLEPQARALLDHAGLPWHPTVLRHHEGARQRVISTPSRYDVARPVYRDAVARWRRLAHHLEPVLGVLEPWAVELGYPPR